MPLRGHSPTAAVGTDRTAMTPQILHIVAWVSLAVALGCAVVIAADECRRPQPMWIMNVVWPITALFGSGLWLWFYFRHGRASVRGRHASKSKSDPAVIAKATNHCGAGCALGDVVGEGLALAVPAVLQIAGWNTVFAQKIFATWVIDFVFAYLAGIAFQYFTIVPMAHISPTKGIVRALKADTASITAWQIGMYGAMALIQLVLFSRLYGHIANPDTPEFWFAMQIAMLCGFCTSYPVNALLLRLGVKEPM